MISAIVVSKRLCTLTVRFGHRLMKAMGKSYSDKQIVEFVNVSCFSRPNRMCAACVLETMPTRK